MNWLDRSREDSKDEHMHLSDAVLESVVVFRLGAGAVAEVVYIRRVQSKKGESCATA